MEKLKPYDITFTFRVQGLIDEFTECLHGYDEECVKETIGYCYDVVEFISIKECEHFFIGFLDNDNAL